MTTVMNFRNKRGWEGAPLLWQLVRRNRAWMGLIFILTFAALPLQYMLAIFTEQMAFLYLSAAEKTAQFFYISSVKCIRR